MWRTLQSRFIRAPGLVVIGYVLAIVLILYGLIVIGPWYTSNMSTILFFAFATDTGRILAGLFCLISGALYIYSYWVHALRERAAFLVFLCYFFSLIIRVVIVGWMPVTWIFLLCLSIVSAIVYLKVDDET